MAKQAIAILPPTDEVYRKVATEVWCNEELEIDVDAVVSSSDLGAWVQAWVWVSDTRSGIDSTSNVSVSNALAASQTQ